MSWISYDLAMTDDMAFAEGAFRLRGRDWQVFVFKKMPVQEIAVAQTRWPTAITGVFIDVPESQTLNKSLVESVLGGWAGVETWVEVTGPDSMQLR